MSYVDVPGIRKTDGTQVNPATEDKQDSLISKIPTSLDADGGLKVHLQNGTIPLPTGASTEQKQDSILSAILSLGSLNSRDFANEQITPLAADATFLPSGDATKIDHRGSVQILYASLTPLKSVSVVWYSDPTTPLGGLFGTTNVPIRIISGYYVAYHILDSFELAPYYKLQVVNGSTAQTAFPGVICIIGLNRDSYHGVYDFVDAEPTNLTKALVVKQFHQKTTRLTSKVLSAGATFSTKGPNVAFTVDLGTDTFTSVAHGLENGDTIRFTGSTSAPAPLSAGTAYYVVNKTADTFQLATQQGTAALDITGAPSSGTPTWFFVLTAGGFTANAQGYFAATNWADMDLQVFGTPANAQGTLYFYFSHDGITDHVGPVSVPVGDLTRMLPWPLRNFGYWKLSYTNNAVSQSTFAIFAVQRATVAADLTRGLTSPIGPGEPIKVTRSLVEPSLRGERGILGADKGVFGSAITSNREPQLQADFSQSIANIRVTSTLSGGGSANQSLGQMTLATSTAATASARLQTIGSVKYQPGAEIFCVFTARFTTGVANSHQRIGLYDDNNGLFLGYQGTTFGFTVRSGASDTFTPLTSATGDPLDGSGSSRFFRGDFTEPIDLTKVNVWRIRFGWLGTAIVDFEVMNPEGIWMLVHRVRQPNSATTPHIQNPNLPIRAEVIKSSADSTNIILGSGSWSAGISGSPSLSDFSKLLQRIVNNDDEMRLDVEPTNADYYVGIARDGTATSAASWNVARIYLSSTKNPTRMRFRQSVAWDSRTSGWS